MDVMKIVGIGFVGMFLSMFLKEYKREYVVYISLIVGISILMYCVSSISKIMEFINSLDFFDNYNEYIKLLIKITGISILIEYVVAICKDSGENAIASKIDYAGKIMIISISIPILYSTLESLLNVLNY